MDNSFSNLAMPRQTNSFLVFIHDKPWPKNMEINDYLTAALQEWKALPSEERAFYRHVATSINNGQPLTTDL